MTNLTQLTLSDAVDGLKAKKFSSQEITQAFLDNIAASNETLNAYVVVTPDKAIDMAKASDAKLAKGKKKGEDIITMFSNDSSPTSPPLSLSPSPPSSN
jgi:Asp-tRNA(Asn)/Glu-tRNA(Gln) amidotransferase A subunit family amidase